MIGKLFIEPFGDVSLKRLSSQEQRHQAQSEITNLSQVWTLYLTPSQSDGDTWDLDLSQYMLNSKEKKQLDFFNDSFLDYNTSPPNSLFTKN